MQQFSNQPLADDDEYYVIPIGYNADGDPILHTPDHPFCDDMGCPCHEDGLLIGELGQHVTDGLATPADADRIFRGRQV